MIYKLFLLIFFFWKIVNAEVTNLIITHPKEGSTYRIGENVKITCMVEDAKDFSVLFRHKQQNVAENGHSYNKDLIVNKYPEKQSTKYTLEIKELSWSHNGLWGCVHGDSKKELTISIIVPGTVEPIKSELELSTTDKRPLMEINNHLPQILLGKGIKTNPFDLTREARIKLHCRTGCSNPQSNHSWMYNNITMSKRSINATHVSRSSCSLSQVGDGYFTESTVIIGCHEFQMVGSNEVTCKINDYNDSQSVYVLCPGGHKPWTLTNGEIIGLSVAFALAALMLVLFFMSAKKIINSYRYGSVVGGIRV